MKKIVDSQNRTFKTLRLSLTNACNLACTYCVNENSNQSTHQIEKQLDYFQLVDIIKILHQTLDLQTIRLTGGEPTLYHNIVPLIKEISKIGVKIKITTNGFLLKNLINKLDCNALDSINVSLDAMDEDVFFQISKRRSLHKIIDGIDAALAKKIHIKLNTVVMRGVNDSQILSLLAFSFSKNISIRFLELMKMGHVHEGDFSKYFSQDEILEVIQSKYSITKLYREDAATANYWMTNEGHKFGIIANESDPFCADCNRLRLDSFGNIYGCLSSNIPINISQVFDNEFFLYQSLQQAMKQKQNIKFTGSDLSMLEIGG